MNQSCFTASTGTLRVYYPFRSTIPVDRHSRRRECGTRSEEQMCRWAAYCGDPLYLEELVSSPAHSLIEQSHCATRAKTATNGDGFGIAWYGDRPEPGRYRDVLPA